MPASRRCGEYTGETWAGIRTRRAGRKAPRQKPSGRINAIVRGVRFQSRSKSLLFFPRDFHRPHILFFAFTLRSHPLPPFVPYSSLKWRPQNSQPTWVPVRTCWSRSVAFKVVARCSAHQAIP